MKTLSQFPIGDTLARYLLDESTGRVGLWLLPASMENSVADRRTTLAGEPEIDGVADSVAPSAFDLDSLVHLKLVGDPYPGAFAQGRTMRDGPSVDRFRYAGQDAAKEGSRNIVTTVLLGGDGCRIEHRLAWYDGEFAAEVATGITNSSGLAITLEMLSSFSLGGITPFDSADASERLRVHRFRSVWSAEGRLETRSIEQLHLERSWSGSAIFSERFGQVGSMPVRGWFPFVAVEDSKAGVIWGAQLAWAGSWQMEIFRRDDQVCISGGQADREFGHWTKTLAPGESITMPTATIACVQGDLDQLCDRLTSVQQRPLDLQPVVERDLPIVFNEWCTTWGDPSEQRLIAIADRLKGSEVKYLVIDAGWYKTGTAGWFNSHGDWIPSRTLFPSGLAATTAAIRERGLIPGLWFEMETCGEKSAAFSLVDHLLKRDGIPITVRSRRFWNLNDPFAVQYLTERVIDLLEQCGFGYLKVDYNETIGIGNEGDESPNGSLGEGLRLQIEGVYRFFDSIRKRLPNLVVENCSSGGHRLEPSMLGRTAMSSFSDAHELKEIPIIAANLHRLMLPRQSQIWAVLHRSDSDQRLVYSLAATFLGRMCLSGEIDRLTDGQRNIVTRAQHLYRKAVPIIKSGISRKFGQTGESWRHPRGWQGVLRIESGGKSALVVSHSFGDPPTTGEIALASNNWRIVEEFSAVGKGVSIENGRMMIPIGGEFEGRVILLAMD